jgi:hypothetical protein
MKTRRKELNIRVVNQSKPKARKVEKINKSQTL